MKAKKTAIKKRTKTYPSRSCDVLVTQAMLYGVRDELKSLFKSEIHGFKSEVHDLKSEIHGLKSEMHGVKSEVHGLKSEVHGIKSEVHRLGVLIEEQNARNRIVLDGLTSLFHRQDRVENKVSEFEKTLLQAK